MEDLVHIGVRITNEMKKVIQEIAKSEDSNESIVVRRILKKNLPKELKKSKQC